ncbi:MAG: AtuA-related protein, partial [Acidimicrobiales bacterium]
ELSRTDHEDPHTNDQATARWTITVKSTDPDMVGRAFSNAVFQTALASIPGMHSLSGGPSGAEPFGVFRAEYLDAVAVPQYVHIGGETKEVSSVAPAGVSARVDLDRTGHAPTGSTARAPLGTIVGARSGDKGGNANVGVFARTDEGWTWLDDFLTIERLRELLPETFDLHIERHRLPRIRSLNFVIHDLLGDGVAASTRPDAQAKSLGEWLRARIVDIPLELL